MQLQPQKEITVDGEKYIVQLYAPTFGLTLHAKLLDLVSGSLAKLFGMFKGLKGKSVADLVSGGLAWDDLDMDALGDSVAMLFGKLKPEEVAPLMLEILSCTFYEKTKQPVVATFESDFAGRYLHLYKLVGKTVGVQYADFLSGVVKRTNAASAARAGKATGAAK